MDQVTVFLYDFFFLNRKDKQNSSHFGNFGRLGADTADPTMNF